MEYKCDLSDAIFYEEEGVLVGFTQACGFDWERNDCGVTTLALTAGIPYKLAHALLKLFGRQDGSYAPWMSFVYRGPFKWRAYVVKPITIRRFIQKHPKGRYAIVLRPTGKTCHLASIIDGVFLNGNIDSVRSRIYFAWRCEGLKKGI
jgi:hypothetical protein